MPPATEENSQGILRLRLQTRKLEEMRRFYTETLQLPLVAQDKNSITLRAGGTELIFYAVETGEPYYHFAFNIPENKLAASKIWLKPRAPLIQRPDGRDEYFFESWNAHAVYFLDPSGNILEFIARHNLKNAAAGDFSVKDILHASEIALVVDDVAATVTAARAALGALPFSNSLSDQFAALGTDHRLLIVVKRGRQWNSGHGRAAEVFPVRAVIRGAPEGRLAFPPLDYEVLQKNL